MKYLVQTVGDHELPEGMTRVIVERDDGPPILLISGDAARCWRFMRTWEDTLEPSWQPTVTLPLTLPMLHAVI
jgi:hypothetical protein